ncbi:peptidase S41 [Kosakonia sp. MUSA4]|uniref:peptidase S41 n=1 Tax=Kosakonia sp. MUSA4 TaxID=2067958 RepID=UPI001598BC0C|nr:peptidase S41 [Kosakonia sp. MUSA4]QJT80627.1 peptidase S41 [Kosakonia sp. MUSA4]
MHMNRRKFILGSAVLLASPALAWELPRPGTTLPNLTLAQIQEDLLFLRAQWAPLEKSFNPSQRVTFNKFIDNAVARAATASPADLVLDVMQAVAIPRNGHTAPMVGHLLDSLPIKLWWFSDGLYILSVAPGYESILGSRVEKFGQLTTIESLERVAPYISGTDQRIRYLSASYLTSKMVLDRIGVLSSQSRISLTLRLRNGETKTVSLSVSKPDYYDAREPILFGWSSLIPDEKGKENRWTHVLDEAEKRSPGYGKPEPLSVQWMGDGEKILYIRSNFIHSMGKDSLADALLFGVIQKQVVPKKPRFIVVDLRLNNGGNFFETMLFSQTLPKLLPRDGQIFVLVSRATFSAALVTVATLKRANPAKVILIGETMGDNGHFWAEPETITLPNSRIQVFYSTKFEDFEQGCAGNIDCYWPAAVFAQSSISLAPEVKIAVPFIDYAMGHDPVLDAVIDRTK